MMRVLVGCGGVSRGGRLDRSRRREFVRDERLEEEFEPEGDVGALSVSDIVEVVWWLLCR